MNSDDVGSLVRHTVTTVGGALVTSGAISGSDLQALAGAVSVIAAVAWSLYQKRQQRTKLQSVSNANIALTKSGSL